MNFSDSYRRAKKWIHWIIEEPSCPYRRWYHLSMMAMVFCSMLGLVLEAEFAHDPHLATLFEEIGLGFTLVFLTEYLLRWWVCSSMVTDYRQAVRSYHRRVYRPARHAEILTGIFHASMGKLRWMVQPMSIIDLLSVLPLLRIFRLLRVIQLFKFFRYSRRIHFFSNILGERRYEMVSLVYAGVVMWGAVAVAFFIAEHGHNAKVDHFGAAVYWAIITITTVGYGDIAPVTEAGRVIASLGVLTGMSVTVLLTSLIVSVFTDRLFNLKEYLMEQQIAQMQNHFIVCGLHHLGQFTCSSLTVEKKPFVAIDQDQQLVDKALKQGWVAIKGDINDKETWERAGLNRASCVVSSILNEATNVYIILNVREVNPKCFVVACGGQPHAEERLLRVGADRVVAPFQNGGRYLAQTAMRPSALQFFNLALDQGYASLVMEEIPIAPGSIFDYTYLRDSDLRSGYDTMVVGVLARGVEMIFNPKADYRLMAGDVIICLGHKDDLERLKRASRQIAIDNMLDRLELTQIWVGPKSPCNGMSILEADLRSRYKTILVGIAKGGKEIEFKLKPDMHFATGDVMLCLGPRDQIDAMRADLGDFTHTPMNYINMEMERINIPLESPLRSKTLRHSMIRSSYFCNVVAIQPAGDNLVLDPLPDYRFAGGEVMICLGTRPDLNRLKEAITSSHSLSTGLLS